MTTERRYRALLLGNWEFPEEPVEFPRLLGPPTDLELLRAALTDPQYGLHRPEDVKVLRNEPVMRMRRAIEVFLKSGRRDEQLLVYYSGHGRREESGDLYLCAHDTSNEAIRSTTVHTADVADQFQNSRAASKIVILDCCYSGNYRHKGQSAGTVFDGRGVVVLSSSQMDRNSRDAEVDGRPSQFTSHLVDALRGAARDTDGYFTPEDIYEYVHDQMEADGPNRPTYSNLLVGRVVLGRATRHAGKQPAPPDPEQVANRFGTALRQVETNRAAAARAFRELSDDGGEGWGTLAALRLGALAAEDGDHETAIAAYEKAAAAGHPGWSAEASFRLGVELDAVGAADRAAAAWRKAVERDDPSWSPAAARLLGRLLVATPATVPAGLRYYRQALASAPGDTADAALELGDALHRAGQLDEARAIYRRLAQRTDSHSCALGRERLSGLSPPAAASLRQ